MHNKIIFLALTLLLIIGCEKKQETSTIPEVPTQPMTLTTAPLMVEPIKTLLVETPNELLPEWRTYSSAKPTLVLFSNDPFLQPVPNELQDQALNLAMKGTRVQIQEKAVNITSDPILLHSMTLDVALRAGMFAEVIWVVPFKEGQPLPLLEDMQDKLRESELLSEEEISSLIQQGPNLVGTFRNTLYTISDINNLPVPQYPAWVHFDLSFFKPFYKNAVSTPLFNQIISILAKVRDANIQTYGASVSTSNLSGAIALDVRFLGHDLTQMLSDPRSLDTGLTELQARRSQNLYLKEFFKKDEILQNILAMEKLAPDDASVQYDLYNSRREMRQGDEALDSLDKAVTLDRVYAAEYLGLASTAMEKKRPDAALEMLEKAKAAYPDNPLIDLAKVDILLRLGHKEQLLALVDELQDRTWSNAYDQNMPDRLNNIEKLARENE